MKRYQDPIATARRPIRLFLADHGLGVSGEAVTKIATLYRKQRAGTQAIVLDESDWSMDECTEILKFLAERLQSPTYPRDRRRREAVDATMHWLTTGLYRVFGYLYVYPQVFGEYAQPAGERQEAMLRYGLTRTEYWLDKLEATMLAERDYLVGDSPTIADYLGVGYVTLGDWIHFDLAPWPRVQAWVARMRERSGCHSEWAIYDRFSATVRASRAGSSVSHH